MAGPPARQRPQGWGDDPFTKFLDLVHTNQFATFANKPVTPDLIEIDRCFVRIGDGWINPRPSFSTMFFFRAHSAYRASMSLALAGQVAETFPLARVCLEYAAYALHIGKDEQRFLKWLDRSTSPEAKKAMIREFMGPRIKESIRQYDKRLEEVFTELYERTIDYGAHPNQDGLLISLQRIDHGDREEYKSVFLHEDGYQLDFSLRTVAQVGLFALRAIQFIYPERYMLLGVRDRLVELQKNY